MGAAEKHDSIDETGHSQIAIDGRVWLSSGTPRRCTFQLNTNKMKSINTQDRADQSNEIHRFWCIVSKHILQRTICATMWAAQNNINNKQIR